MSNQKNKYFNLLYKRNRRGNGFTGGGWKKAYAQYSECILGWYGVKYTTQVGAGIVIDLAAYSSVVSPSVVIANNVTLRQNTIIESKGVDGLERSPIIEDDVNIGSNVCIIGIVHLGNKSVVAKNVPAGVVVAGNPANVIRMADNDVIKTYGAGENFRRSLIRFAA